MLVGSFLGSARLGRKSFHRHLVSRGPASPRSEPKTSWGFSAEYFGPHFRDVSAEDFKYDLDRITGVFLRNGFVVASHNFLHELEYKEEIVILER